MTNLEEQWREKLEEQRDEDEDAFNQASSLMDFLIEDANLPTSETEKTDVMNALSAVLVEIAHEAEGARLNEAFDRVKQAVYQKIGGQQGLSAVLGLKKEVVDNGVLAEVRDAAQDSAVEFYGNNPEKITLEYDAIGYDEYFERHLERIEKVVTTDVTGVEPKYEFVFEEPSEAGSQQVRWTIELGEYTDFMEVTDKLKGNTELEVQRRTASWYVLRSEFDNLYVGSKEFKKYREASLGPEERPWHGDYFDDCMENLVKSELFVTESPNLGPRTETLEYLKAEIKESEITTDKASAVEHQVLFWDAGREEVWVPSSKVSAACEKTNVQRQGLIAEVHARGVVSDELRGRTVSEEVRAGEYFWRFDATHDEIPHPGELGREFSDSIGRAFGPDARSTGDQAVADGGHELSDEDDAADSDNESGGEDE